MYVCRTDCVYHYLINDDSVADSIIQNGLLPLSSFPESPRWKLINQHLPGVFESLYTLFAEPILKKPYTNSGIFLTPIDFHQMTDLPIATCTRLSIPTSAIDADSASLTYELGGQRVVLAFDTQALREVQTQWTEDMVRAWFGRDNSRMFFYVPQVVTYQDRIPISADWVQ